MTQLERAKLIAAQIHAGQTRRDGTTPYLTHVEDVATRVLNDMHETSPNRDIYETVAWLHDVVEDCPRLDVRHLTVQGFSRAITDAVDALTKRSGERYADYIERLTSNPIARFVKIHDILSNLSDAPTDEQLRRYVQALAYILEVKPLEYDV